MKEAEKLLRIERNIARLPEPNESRVVLSSLLPSHDFLPTPETSGRALFSPFEARTLSWVQINRDLYEAALWMVTNEADSDS